MSVCAPNIKIQDHYSCFDYDELKEIALAFNIYIQTNKVCGSEDACIPSKLIDINSKTKKELWYSIYNRLEPICKYEYCWVDLGFLSKIKDASLREKINYFTFKPKMTLKIDSWLNTKDINNVLQQYQEFDLSFKFLGALPSDFYKVTRVNYNDIYNYKKIGIVFNLDDHTQPGSHWVSFLIDNTKKTIEYYDSAGRHPNKNINEFIKRVRNFLKKNGDNYVIKYNKLKHQYKNSECGVYAIYFIIQRLLGYNFDNISKNIITDDEMNKFRRYIFRPRV